MAPEQARGLLHELDDRTDVFAVGALLYHVLTREPPYRAETFLAALVRAQCVSFTPLEELAPHVPRALARIVARAMAASPDDRHPSVAALRHDLQQFARGGGLFAAVHVPKGETIVRQGEPGATAYIIEHGSLEVSRVDDGERRVLRVMGPGEVFGEMAILAPGPRTASVTALEPSTLRVVTAETLEREVESLKPWMGALVRTLATRFREREERDRVG
jgi:serine/threonine-protein kinase